MSKLLNSKDFFMCTGGMMPTQMQSHQSVALKKDNETKFLLKIDTATSPIADFSCKKLMILMAVIAVIVCAIVISTGGMALIAAAAVGGLIGAAIGSLICGQTAAPARVWLGWKNDFKIKGIETLTDSANMKCMIFGDEIRIAPFIKNWWQAAAVGLTNFAGEMFKCVMVGAAAAGVAVLATEGLAAFFGNALLNYAATWTTGWGLGLRGMMGIMDGVQGKYVRGESTEDAVNSGFGTAFTGMERGTANSAYNVATGQGTFEDYTGLLGWGAPVARGNNEHGPNPADTDHMASNPWEGKPQSGKTGYLESPRMSRSEYQAYKRSMNEQGIDVQIDKSGKLNENSRAGFDNETGTVYLRKGATQYEAFHEGQHARQWREIGKEAYQKQSRVQKEQYVYDQIMANKENFSQAELDHAKNYMNEVRRLAGMEPMQMDAMGKGKDGDLFEDPAGSKAGEIKSREQQIEESREAYNKSLQSHGDLPVSQKGKTTASDGINTVSGHSPSRISNRTRSKIDVTDVAPEKVMKRSENINHSLSENASIDNGVPGQAAASHAEKQIMTAKPGDPLGVSREMCNDCIKFAQKHANEIGADVVITDPNGTKIFESGGTSPIDIGWDK